MFSRSSIVKLMISMAWLLQSEVTEHYHRDKSSVRASTKRMRARISLTKIELVIKKRSKIFPTKSLELASLDAHQPI